MRRMLGAIAVVAGLAAGLPGAPAQATSQSINASPSNTYFQRVTAVKPSETATITNSTGVGHNLTWEDGTPGQATAGQWQTARTFTHLGAFRYYCSIHGGRGGVGMSGVVYVTASGFVPPPGIFGATAFPTPPADATLRVTSTEPALLQGILYRRSPSGTYFFFGRLNRSVLGGSNSIHFTATSTGRALTAGAYHLSFRLVSGPLASQRRSLLRTVYIPVHG